MRNSGSKNLKGMSHALHTVCTQRDNVWWKFGQTNCLLEPNISYSHELRLWLWVCVCCIYSWEVLIIQSQNGQIWPFWKSQILDSCTYPFLSSNTSDAYVCTNTSCVLGTYILTYITVLVIMKLGAVHKTRSEGRMGEGNNYCINTHCLVINKDIYMVLYKSMTCV